MGKWNRRCSEKIQAEKGEPDGDEYCGRFADHRRAKHWRMRHGDPQGCNKGDGCDNQTQDNGYAQRAKAAAYLTRCLEPVAGCIGKQAVASPGANYQATSYHDGKS